MQATQEKTGINEQSDANIMHKFFPRTDEKTLKGPHALRGAVTVVDQSDHCGSS